MTMKNCPTCGAELPAGQTLKKRYSIVGAAANRQGPVAVAGDLIRSKWSSSGAIWRIESITAGRPNYYNGGVHYLAASRSVSSGRTDTKYLADCVIVKEVTA